MRYQLQLLIILSLLAAWTEAQVTTPTEYKWDCRRTDVDCQQQGSTCNVSGLCNCAAGYEGYDCGLQTSLKLATCASGNKCENNGVCLQEDKCYCNSDTYGDKCENARVKMWCTETQMFININPHGSFSGQIYLQKSGGDGKSDANCQFTAVSTTPPDLTQYTYVQTAQKATPTLAGQYLVQNHVPADGATGVCQAAQKTETTDRTQYLQTVVIVYKTTMITSVDQRVQLNCSITKTAGDKPLTSENVMSVPLNSDDLQGVDVTETIVPVLFEIKDPKTNLVLTNNVNLGDDLNLVFTMQVTTADNEPDTTLKQFKVTECTASNGQPIVDGVTNNWIKFIESDCPKTGSEMLYRGLVKQTLGTNSVEVVIPLSAFRFVGTFDSVAFTCVLKLCDKAMLTADANACTKNTCPGDTTGTPATTAPDTGGSTASGGAASPNTGGAASPNTGGAASPNTGGATNPNAPSTGRRKRRSAGNSNEQVSKTIQVNSPLKSSSQTGTGEEPPNKKKEEEQQDCMQHSEVVIIIVIFTVILFLLLLAMVILVVHFLRSRKKVAGSPAPSLADTQSHYTLPRLSLATTM